MLPTHVARPKEREACSPSTCANRHRPVTNVTALPVHRRHAKGDWELNRHLFTSFSSLHPVLEHIPRPSFSAQRLNPKTLEAAAAVADEVFDQFVVRMGGGGKRAFKDDVSAIELLSNWIAAEFFSKVSSLALVLQNTVALVLRSHSGLCAES